jgi:hypothetical protein
MTLFLNSCFPVSQDTSYPPKLSLNHYHGAPIAIYYEYGSASPFVLYTNIIFETGAVVHVNGFWSLRVGSIYSFSLDSKGNIISIGFGDNEENIK